MIRVGICCTIILILCFLGNDAKFRDVEIDEENSSSTSNVSPPFMLTSNAECPSGVECRKLGGACVDCSPGFNNSCVYGKDLNVTCRARDSIVCTGSREFTRTVRCQYCYQTEKWEHKCVLSPNCKSADSPRKYYLTNCTVRSAVVCLGNRVFQKKLLCNWTSGYHWRTVLILSIVLGGFGVDRFYLGYWQEGLGKFFSFGGLGVWTLIDVILISLHYLGPADGSLYI